MKSSTTPNQKILSALLMRSLQVSEGQENSLRQTTWKLNPTSCACLKVSLEDSFRSVLLLATRKSFQLFKRVTLQKPFFMGIRTLLIQLRALQQTPASKY